MMYGDDLPDWHMAQDERLRRAGMVRVVLLLALVSVAMTFAVMIVGGMAA